MKRRTDQEQLLNDLLADESAADSNAVALGRLLRLAGRRRRVRQAQRLGAVLAVVAAAVFALFVHRGPQRTTTELAREGPGAPACETVASFALTPEQLVVTRPLLPDQMVRSESAVTVVHTTAADIPSVNDEELLELAKPNIAVLVRRGPHEAELVFVAPPLAHN